MQVYLVGGAVRDELLGRPVKERDWVVVGATPEELGRLGYLRVGRDFPVFLHPQTREEYALARQERKVGAGYRGFVTEFSPQVTLEQDLARRDLTINAIARAPDGTLIAYAVHPLGGGSPQIYTMHPDGSNVTLRTSDYRWNGGRNPSWIPRR